MKSRERTTKYSEYTKADEVAPASWTAPVLWRFWIMESLGLQLWTHTEAMNGQFSRQKMGTKK